MNPTAWEALPAATVRLARHVGYLYGEDNPAVVLAAACALSALRAGSVCFDVAHPGDLRLGAEGPASPDWPATDDWLEALRGSPMVSTDLGARDRPLILDGARLYLTRYWAEQERVVAWLTSRLTGGYEPGGGGAGGGGAGGGGAGADQAGGDQADGDGASGDWAGAGEPGTTGHHPGADLADGTTGDSDQHHAAALAASQPVCVVAGGPGTGKTTTIALIVSAVARQQPDPLRVILTAPTGRAAARLEQAVRLNLDTTGSATPPRCVAGTIHRILGLKPWGNPDHDANRPLPADLVVVDEASMLSLHLMAGLLDAIPASARLVLVGDPDQLTSVEAGAVLADIVANADTVPVARLRHTYRFAGALARLADAIRRGSAEEALAVLDAPDDQIEWIACDIDAADDQARAGLRHVVVDQARRLTDAASRADGPSALAWLDHHRLLLAHRHGGSGVAHWSQVARTWIGADSPGARPVGPWYPGLPVLITRNDDLLSVFNGDCGVIVSGQASPRLALPAGDAVRYLAPDLVQSWEPLYASTIHKAQGSQYDRVSLILPPTGTVLLTRELFYTAVTRAKSFLRVIGSPAAIRQAVASPALRASGLASRLAAVKPDRS
jgi:exodeoxyribonuclease V alpha subunit